MNRRGNKPVHAVVIGDEGVGKTSLITAAATESFPDLPPPVLPPTRLPAEATPENVPMLIMDTCSRDEEKTSQETACVSADVILLLFATERDGALDRVRTYWLPELRRLGVKAPVILVGTKSDLKSADRDLQQAVVSVMSQFKEIETCLECSSKNLVFVGEVFYYALKAVVHPTAALFDAMTQTLKPLCVNALRRIFMMCDQDNDDVLNDAELNAFQVRCFNAPLQPEELMGVKKVVQDKMPQGVSATGLTLQGFLFLHALFIERGRLETTWAVLRKFGYSDELRISLELLEHPSFAHSPDQVVELTDAGRQFLLGRFARFDRNKDGMLSTAEQDEMFSTAPSSPWAGPPYEGLLVEGGPGGLTRAGFLAKWAALTARAPKRTLEHMMYLGFEGDAAPLFSISRPRRVERRAAGKATDTPTRHTYQAMVFGGPGVGKTTLLARLAGQQAASGAPPSVQQGAVSAAGSVKVHRAEGAEEATLLAQELNEGAASALLQSPSCAARLAAVDVATFIFDSTSLASFRTAHQLMLAVAQAAGDTLPCVFVAAKDDLGMSQDLVGQCSSALAELRLRAPLPATLTGGADAAELFSQVVAAAQDAKPHIPLTPSLRAHLQYRRSVQRALLYTAVGAGTGVGLLFAWRWYSSSKYSSGSPAAVSADAASAAPPPPRQVQ